MQEMPRKIFFHRVLNRGRRTESRLLFGSFCRSKKNVKTFPFRELPDKQEVCPCRGSTLRVLFSFRKVPRLANLESSHRSHPFRQKPTKPQKTEKKGIKSSKRRKERVKKEEKRGKKCKKGLTKGEESGNIIKLRKGAGAREARETGSAREGARDCDFEWTKMSKRNLKKV